MNNYTRLSHVRNEVNGSGTTAQDADILRAIARASEAARTATERIFHTEVATAYFHGNGKSVLRLAAAAVAPYRGDLLDVTTLKVDDNGDGVYEYTLVEGTDYWLGPDVANRGATHLQLITDRTTAPQIYTWPKAKRSVEIVGKWAYSERWDAVVVSGTAVTGTLADTGADLTLTASVSVANVIDAGDTIKIEDEQCEVTAVAATEVTVVRAINGTTGAAHTAKALSLRRFPEDLERAVAADAARYLWRASQGYPETSFREMWPAIHEAVGAYSMLVVG